VKDVLDAVMRLLSSETGQVTRLRVESGEAAVELEWGRVNGHPVLAEAAVNGHHAGSVNGTAVALAPAPSTADAAPGQLHVAAPMVGTFYHAPAPGEPAFVKVGDVVEPGQQVGILEAMKLMNPIEADRAGRVVEILVPDATPVEYDQPLIALVPVEDA
jgi:acetyl-CoA carboxylase biotin carboxyl carrier protein